jgi:tetratricopeptide (TPR) repeat protein
MTCGTHFERFRLAIDLLGQAKGELKSGRFEGALDAIDRGTASGYLADDLAKLREQVLARRRKFDGLRVAARRRLRDGNTGEALKLIDRALRLSPKHERVLRARKLLARTMRHQRIDELLVQAREALLHNDFEIAGQCAEKMFSLQPRDPRARAIREHAANLELDFAQAQDAARRARQALDLEEAVRQMNALRQRFPRHSRLGRDLVQYRQLWRLQRGGRDAAIQAEQTGDVIKALKIWKNLSKLDPQDADAAEAVARLEASAKVRGRWRVAARIFGADASAARQKQRSNDGGNETDLPK